MKTEDKESHRNRRQSREVEVEEMSEGDDYNYLFVCNRWLARDEDDGQIVRELVPMDATGRPRRDSLPGKLSVIMNANSWARDNLFHSFLILRRFVLFEFGMLQYLRKEIASTRNMAQISSKRRNWFFDKQLILHM